MFFIISMTGSMFLLPNVSAHNPPYQIPTWIYCVSSPNPVGVGQTVTIFWWLDDILPTTNGIYGDLVTNVTMTLTLPDGTNKVLSANLTGDPIGGGDIEYTPTTVGNYSVVVYYPGQTLRNANPGPVTNSYNTSPYIGDYYEPATSTAAQFAVQQAPITTPQFTPLPTGYWNTPITGDNFLWSTISGNWVGAANAGFGNPTQGNINDYSTAPTTPHIVWTKPIDIGGMAGGVYSGGITNPTPGVSEPISYATGTAYESTNYIPIVIDGILYVNMFDTPRNGYYAVDLATGETLWYHNSTGPLLIGTQTAAHITGTDIPWQYPQLNFAQVMDYDTPNQEGVKSMLWSTYTFEGAHTAVGASAAGATPVGLQTYYPNETIAPDQVSGTGVWIMIDPNTGNPICTLYNVPSSGVQFAPSSQHTDPNGNILIYNLDTSAGTSNWLTMWNSTDAVNYPANNNYTTTSGEAYYWMWRPPIGSVINAAKDGYDWNVTVPASIEGGAIAWVGDNEILGTTGLTSFQYGVGPYSIWALSLAPATRGQLLWQNFYPSPPTLNATVTMGPVDPINGVFTVRQKETLQWFGYSLATGKQLWGPTPASESFDMYGLGGTIYNGALYSLGYAGILHAYNITTGVPLWTATTDNGGTSAPYPYIPVSGALTISDGVIYAQTAEHHVIEPFYPGWSIYAWNATTGQNLFNMTGFWGSSTIAIADGYVIDMNYEDMQIYCFGLGQTKTTVAAPTDTVTQGTPVLIQGTVMDQSPGSTLPIYDGISQAPGNVNSPAVADVDQVQQMHYLYQQAPAPSNDTGVTVTLTAIDPNGNAVNIGQGTSDSAGMFQIMYTPKLSGLYTIIAQFSGSGAYFASSAETSMAVAAASTATPAPTQPPTNNVSSMDFFGLSAAIIVVIIIAAAAIIILGRRK